MTDVQQCWLRAAEKLRALLNEDTYDRWISGIVPLSIDDTSCRLGVSNDIFCEWLTSNYRDLISAAVGQVLENPVEVVFESGHEPPKPATASPSQQRQQTKKRNPIREEKDDVVEGRYSQHFVFDTFVVGENNRFAHAACVAVAKSPGRAYNPLFVHGATGLGKTHLLQAIAQEVLGRRKRARIEYLSSEEFANRYIDALRDRALPKFRRHYRHVDVLLIDDVQFFNKGKEQLQQEFFHTFNALYHAHKQIVLTSDRPPHEIGGLEKRLVSRFEWGLTTEILAPDLETRVAILKLKQADQAVTLDDDTLFFVASRVKSNIRRLEGALIRLVSYASMTGLRITTDLAEQLLRPLLEQESMNALTIEKIQRTVADFYDIRVADMLSKKRPKNIAVPRQIAMFLCRRLTDHSSPTIADFFNRNHATVLHAANTIEQRMQNNTEFRQTIGHLEHKLQA